MSRLTAAVHLGWMVVVLAVALWAGWVLRFEGDQRGRFYLDRWTGEVVESGTYSDTHERYSLRRPVQREWVVRKLIEDPEGVAGSPGAFDDLIPPERSAR